MGNGIGKPKIANRQEVFVAEYAKDFNGKRAAIAAGYSPKTAEAQASRMLRNSKVVELLAAKQEKRIAKLDKSADDVLSEISKLAFANMQDYIRVTNEGEAFVDFSSLTREQAAAIQEIRVDETAGGIGDGRRERVQRTTFKLSDKGLNLERLGRYFKLFTDKVEVTGLDELAEKMSRARRRTA